MRERSSFGMIFMIAFVAGILTMNFGKSILVENTGLLDENMLRQMTSVFPDSNALFAFVLRKRLALMGILIVAATTYLGVAACAVVTGWFGFAAGAFLATALMRYGFKGLLLVAAGTMPQYLLYIPSLYALLLWCEKTCRMIYGRGHRGSLDTKTPILLGRVLPLLVIFVGLYAGCFLESFVNPTILRGFLKIL